MAVEKRVLSDGALHVSITGEIGDDFDFKAITDAARGDKVVLHLAGVRGMTSIGVRNFEELVNGFGVRDVVLIHISPAVASQVAMIPALCLKARIESAKLPFLCPRCGAERVCSLPWKARAHLTNAPLCSCGVAMELDGMAEQYLPSV